MSDLKGRVLIDGVPYVPETEIGADKNGLRYAIVRTYSAGVFAGYVKSHEGKQVVLCEARRLWRWFGSASLSQLATTGTSKPQECKFPQAVVEIILTEAIEIIWTTAAGQLSIEEVPVWKE